MKKFYLLITIICIFSLTGCGEIKRETDIVNDYISNAKISAWVDTGSNYIKSTINLVNEGRKLLLFSSDILYMIPVGNDANKSCVKVEYGADSPFSNSWNYAYVGVAYNSIVGNYSHYFIAEDGAGYGVNLLTRKEFMSNGNNLMYFNSSRDNKDFGDYLTQKYNIKENDIHELTNLEKSAYQKILSEFPTITKVVYIAGGSDCRFQ